MPTRNKIQVFDVSDPKWTCTIDSGVLGVDFAMFSPDGRHVISSAEFNINYTVFSLVTKSVKTIEWPKDPRGNIKTRAISLFVWPNFRGWYSLIEAQTENFQNFQL
jgi:hypothetical protein